MSSTKVWENLTKNPYVGVGLTAVVVAVAGYFLLKKAASDSAAGLSTIFTKVSDATGLTTLGQSLTAVTDTQTDPGTDTLASWYDPTQRTVFFYYLTFPDGTSHFVGASSVNTDGTFIYSQITYRIGTSKAGDLRAYPWNQQTQNTSSIFPDPGVSAGW
jgi:hypothetical protein